MRYIIITITLVVLAMASPAMSVCPANQQVTARSDCDLPVSSPAFSPTDCKTADWVFYFDRTYTYGIRDRSKICIIIDCLDIYYCYRSSEYRPGQSYIIGPYNDQRITDTGPGHLHIYGVGWSCGSFANMDLRVYDFQD